MYDLYEGVDAYMRTTLNISDELIKETQALYGTSNRSKAVEKALADAIRFKQQQAFMELKGKIHIDSDIIDKLRDSENEE